MGANFFRGICFLGMIFISFSAFSATYYIHNENGNDSNSGLSPTLPWKTLNKVNSYSFDPGDNILLSKGQVWSESLIVSSSGIKGSPIIYASYGEGSNPIVKLTTTFNQWTLEKDVGGKKIWKGFIDGNKNAAGATWQGERIPSYLGYTTSSSIWGAPTDLLDMENGFYYSPLNSVRFYFRNDDGNPKEMEISTRTQGVLVKSKKYVILDGIDVFGPGGIPVEVASSDNIIIQNCSVSNSGYRGCMITRGSTNCIFDNIKSYNHRSSGLYIVNAGLNNVIKNCESYGNGFLITDSGDQGCIGVESSRGNIVEHCYAHDNGHDGADAIDAAISIYESPECIVNRCYVKNSGDKAIMFAGETYDCVASYNVIDTWGVYGASITKWPSVDGLRLGGGETNCKILRTKIYNNLFINGGKIKGSNYASLRIQYRENSGTVVRNNIFYNNLGVYEINAESKDNFAGWEFSNNVFYRTDGNAIKWGGQVYNFKHILGNSADFYSYDSRQGVGSMLADPLLAEDKMDLTPESPCVDAGSDVRLLKDFHGRDLYVGSGVDIGPFEYLGRSAISPPKGVQVVQ